MAGNTRGKLKEHFEGIHRNFDWIMYHCEKSLFLIADKNPKMSDTMKALAEGIKTLDGITQDLYSRL